MSQPKCTFDTCCGCIELRTGCLILGYLSLVGEIIYIIAGLVILAGGSIVIAQGETEEYKNIGIQVVAFAVVFVVLILLAFAFTIVLLVGVHQNKKGHVKAYLICSSVILVLYTISLLASFSLVIEAGTVISRVVGLLFSIYYLLVIRSYYYKMEDRKPAIYNTA